MDDFNSTEAIEAESGEQAGAVAQQESPTEDTGAGRKSVVGSSKNPDFDFVDLGEEDEKPDAAGQDDGKKSPEKAAPRKEAPKQQTPEENARYRSMRLKAQQEAEAEAAKRADAEIAAAGVINPYTEKPFGSMKELREYGERSQKARIAKMAKDTGRPVAELEEDAANRAFLSQLRESFQKPKQQQQQEAPEDDLAAFAAKDIVDFMEKYPDIDEAGIAALENNERFLRFCGSRFGREPLADLYGAYLELVGSAEKAAVAKAATRAAKSTGSGSGGSAILTPAQKAALDRWNADNPEMAMTAKEFLER